MAIVKVVCPHCRRVMSIIVEVEDAEEWSCNKCHETFYVETIIKVTKVKI